MIKITLIITLCMLQIIRPLAAVNNSQYSIDDLFTVEYIKKIKADYSANPKAFILNGITKLKKILPNDKSAQYILDEYLVSMEKLNKFPSMVVKKDKQSLKLKIDKRIFLFSNITDESIMINKVKVPFNGFRLFNDSLQSIYYYSKKKKTSFLNYLFSKFISSAHSAVVTGATVLSVALYSGGADYAGFALVLAHLGVIAAFFGGFIALGSEVRREQETREAMHTALHFIKETDRNGLRYLNNMITTALYECKKSDTVSGLDTTNEILKYHSKGVYGQSYSEVRFSSAYYNIIFNNIDNFLPAISSTSCQQYVKAKLESFLSYSKSKNSKRMGYIHIRNNSYLHIKKMIKKYHVNSSLTSACNSYKKYNQCIKKNENDFVKISQDKFIKSGYGIRNNNKTKSSSKPK